MVPQRQIFCDYGQEGKDRTEKVIFTQWNVYTAHNLAMFTPSGLRGGMVDTRDLKSLGLIGRAGSSPAAGTRFRLS